MANRYWRRGTSKFRFATTIANQASVTRAEITASVDLTPQIAEVNRDYTVSDIATPDWVTDFAPKIPGEKSASMAIKCYDLDGTTDAVRDALPANTSGYVLIFPKGDVVGKRMECWPVRINGGPLDDYSSGTEAARYDVTFSPTLAPSLNDTIPS